LKGALELHFTYDEEFGGLLGRLAARTEADQARPGDRGRLQLRHRHRPQRLPAAGDHGARQGRPRRDAGDGHDALQAATRILNAIYGQLPELKKIKSKVPGIDSPTMLVGRIDGGTNTNVVPGKVVMKMDRRMIPEEDPVAVEAQVRALIEDAVKAARHPPRDPAPAAVARAAPAAGIGQAGGQPAAPRPRR
jgi:succinyl-diaminopimelate desuccinylase